MKAKLALASLITLSMSGVAMADDHGGPKLTGKLHVQYLNTQSGTNDGTRVEDAVIGVKGSVGQGNLKAIYEIELEAANAANGDGNVDVDTARIIVPGKWGAFVIGRSASGQYADLYKGVKIFDNADIANGVYNQVSRAPGVLAWKTPKMGNVYGVVASINAGANDKKADARAARVVYQKGGFHAGIGKVDYPDTDRTRTALGINYDAKRWQVGLTHEDNKSTSETLGGVATTSDFTVTGVAGTFKATPNTAIKLGYFDKAYDNATTAQNYDDQTAIVNVSHKVGKTKFYVEHEAHDLENQDKTAAGMIVNF